MATIVAFQPIEEHQLQEIRQRVRILTLFWAKSWALVTNSAGEDDNSDRPLKKGQEESTKLRQAAMHIAEALARHKSDDIAVGLLLRTDEVKLVLRNSWSGHSSFSAPLVTFEPPDDEKIDSLRAEINRMITACRAHPNFRTSTNKDRVKSEASGRNAQDTQDMYTNSHLFTVISFDTHVRVVEALCTKIFEANESVKWIARYLLGLYLTMVTAARVLQRLNVCLRKKYLPSLEQNNTLNVVEGDQIMSLEFYLDDLPAQYNSVPFDIPGSEAVRFLELCQNALVYYGNGTASEDKKEYYTTALKATIEELQHKPRLYSMNSALSFHLVLRRCILIMREHADGAMTGSNNFFWENNSSERIFMYAQYDLLQALGLETVCIAYKAGFGYAYGVQTNIQRLLADLAHTMKSTESYLRSLNKIPRKSNIISVQSLVGASLESSTTEVLSWTTILGGLLEQDVLEAVQKRFGVDGLTGFGSAVHSASSLAVYLEEDSQSRSIDSWSIGISKPCCAVCKLWLTALNHYDTDSWSMARPSEWELPHDCTITQALQFLQLLERTVKEYAEANRASLMA